MTGLMKYLKMIGLVMTKLINYEINGFKKKLKRNWSYKNATRLI